MSLAHETPLCINLLLPTALLHGKQRTTVPHETRQLSCQIYNALLVRDSYWPWTSWEISYSSVLQSTQNESPYATETSLYYANTILPNENPSVTNVTNPFLFHV